MLKRKDRTAATHRAFQEIRTGGKGSFGAGMSSEPNLIHGLAGAQTVPALRATEGT